MSKLGSEILEIRNGNGKLLMKFKIKGMDELDGLIDESNEYKYCIDSNKLDECKAGIKRTIEKMNNVKFEFELIEEEKR